MSDILLDEKWEAKLADFGLSKMGPPSLSKALIRINTCRIEGTYCYLAPEYAMHGELSDKSDVFSFGVGLFELLCGRSSGDRNLAKERRDLISWASKCKQEGTINEIIDPYLKGKIAPECFKIYVGIASSCVRGEGKDRPAMGEVEVGLEHALQLQESADAAREEGEYDYPIDELTCSDSPIGMYRCTSLSDSDITYSSSMPKLEMNRDGVRFPFWESDSTELCDSSQTVNFDVLESPEMINTGAESL